MRLILFWKARLTSILVHATSMYGNILLYITMALNQIGTCTSRVSLKSRMVVLAIISGYIWVGS